MHRIGAFSKLGKTTVKTLRYYDELGLLTPARIDAATGYRYYRTEQLLRLNDIMALRQMGFSVEEVGRIVSAGSGGTDDLIETLTARRADLARAQDALNLQLSRLDTYLAERKEGLTMQYQATLKDLPACTVFSARRTLASYDELGECYVDVGRAVAAANPDLCCTQPEYCCAIYHDGEYRESDIDVEICQAVEGPGVAADGFEFRELPATRVASVLHRGPYSGPDGLSKAYAYLYGWIESNGLKPSDAPRESYLDGVWNCESDADWLTELQVPVS
ncbi:MAG: MerR family transcriptional regulator [Actinomycetes bacterium]|jgi:DNA-binding transcriptional MerR regulator|nr:MerR family transcriptional regulator [Actinomycetes bacterium]